MKQTQTIITADFKKIALENIPAGTYFKDGIDLRSHYNIKVFPKGVTAKSITIGSESHWPKGFSYSDDFFESLSHATDELAVTTMDSFDGTNLKWVKKFTAANCQTAKAPISAQEVDVFFSGFDFTSLSNNVKKLNIFYPKTDLDKVTLPSSIKRLEIWFDKKFKGNNLPEGLEELIARDCPTLELKNPPKSMKKVQLANSNRKDLFSKKIDTTIKETDMTIFKNNWDISKKIMDKDYANRRMQYTLTPKN